MSSPNGTKRTVYEAACPIEGCSRLFQDEACVSRHLRDQHGMGSVREFDCVLCDREGKKSIKNM